MNDYYVILQLKRIDDTAEEEFMSYAWLQRQGRKPNPAHYDVVYTGSLPDFDDKTELLEKLYMKFNIDHPSDFTGHSLSVSDIVILSQNGIMSCHYVDSIGYIELDDFLTNDNLVEQIHKMWNAYGGSQM